MKLAVIGCGYVGLVSGSCLAEAGHDVVATDNDASRTAALQAGKIPTKSLARRVLGFYPIWTIVI